MRPIRTENSNHTYMGPTPEIADLPCERSRGAVYGVWALTDEEREMIANGAQIKLGIFTEPIPPVSVELTNEPEAHDPDDLRCTQCNGLYRRARGLTRCGWCNSELVESADAAAAWMDRDRIDEEIAALDPPAPEPKPKPDGGKTYG